MQVFYVCCQANLPVSRSKVERLFSANVAIGLSNLRLTLRKIGVLYWQDIFHFVESAKRKLEPFWFFIPI